jgi:hypothetical protein
LHVGVWLEGVIVSYLFSAKDTLTMHSTMVTGRKALYRCCLVGLASLAIASFTAAPAAAKGALPFKGNLTATWDNVFFGLIAPPAHFAGEGNVTHMGKVAQAGTLTLQPVQIAPGVFPGSGTVTFTAANGDKVTFDYVGKLNSVTGEGIGTFTFTSGTGRFRGVSGGGNFYALIDVSLPGGQPMTVVLDGKIDY